uniref:Uncharacterized protein n=1 Tax=Moniliophthora roreri TaxID=221103 RepID=A0A0W0FRP4_MONRR
MSTDVVQQWNMVQLRHLREDSDNSAELLSTYG